MPRLAAASGDAHALGTFPQLARPSSAPQGASISGGFPGAVHTLLQSLTHDYCLPAEAKPPAGRRTWFVHREYEFAVEVTAGPPNSVFCHTKVCEEAFTEKGHLYPSHAKETIPMMQVVTIKNRFIADNQTSMTIEIKQKGTLDLPPPGGEEDALAARCAIRLKPKERYGALPVWPFVTTESRDTGFAWRQGCHPLGRRRPAPRAGDAPCGRRPGGLALERQLPPQHPVHCFGGC